MKRYLLALMAAMLLCAGCGEKAAPEAAPVPTAEQQSEPVTSTQETLPPTEPPTEPTTEPITEPATEPPTEPQVMLHSGLREDGTFSAATLFIGDSLTYNFTGSYLPENGLLGEAKITAQCGSKITAFFDDTLLVKNPVALTLYSPEFEGMGFDEAAASMGEAAEAIYLMWGTNFTFDASADDYIQIVDFLLENCPNATVHLQTIPKGNVAYTIVNERIRGAYAHYRDRGEARVMLIETFDAIGLNTVDGVHLNLLGSANWYQAILDHAAANELPQ